MGSWWTVEDRSLILAGTFFWARNIGGVWLGALALAAWPWPAYPQAKSTPAPSNQSGGSPAITAAITDVTVIDVVSGARRTGITVLTQGDRIAAIGPKIAIPRGAIRVNAKGKFLIPGLWDMHSHHQGTGIEALDLFVAKGVVGTRDMGGDADFILPPRGRVRSGAVLGPEIVASGPMVDDAPANFPYRLHVRNAQEARQAVHDLKQLGVDFIKVHDHTPREVFFAVAVEAPEVGLTVAGHVPITVKVEEAAEAGIRSIEHLSNYDVFGECLTDGDYSAAGCQYSECARGTPEKTSGIVCMKDIVGVCQTPLAASLSNILNHFQPENPTLNIDSPQTWGVITDQSTVGALSGIGGTSRGVPAINPRQMEFGLRLHF